jgi:hypothetical protein
VPSLCQWHRHQLPHTMRSSIAIEAGLWASASQLQNTGCLLRQRCVGQSNRFIQKDLATQQLQEPEHRLIVQRVHHVLLCVLWGWLIGSTQQHTDEYAMLPCNTDWNLPSLMCIASKSYAASLPLVTITVGALTPLYCAVLAVS